MAKTTVTISLDEETKEELKKQAKEGHTSISQWVTDRVWERKPSEPEYVDFYTKV